MGLSLVRDRSGFVGVKALTGLVGVALAVVVVGAALGAPSTKKFTAVVTQTGQNEYLYKLTNHPTSSQTLGSANVTLPIEFAISSATLVNVPTGKTWHSAKVGQTIELRAADKRSALSPGQAVWFTVSLSSAAPCGTFTWETRVKQSNDFLGTGNDFEYVPPSTSPSATGPIASVTGVADAFAFSSIADPQEVGTAFATAVTAKDACAQNAIFYSGTPTLSGLDSAPSQSYVGGTFVAGSANYSVTAVKAQQNAQLSAADGSADGTSGSFDVVTEICDSQSTSCTASHPDLTRVTVPPPPNGITTLSLSGPGKPPFTCDGTQYQNVGSSVLVDPAQGGYTDPIAVVIEWSLVNAPAGSRVVCWSKDGVTYSTIPRCGRTPEPACELNRTRSGDLLSVTVLIDPEDPSFDLG